MRGVEFANNPVSHREYSILHDSTEINPSYETSGQDFPKTLEAVSEGNRAQSITQNISADKVNNKKEVNETDTKPIKRKHSAEETAVPAQKKVQEPVQAEPLLADNNLSAAYGKQPSQLDVSEPEPEAYAFAQTEQVEQAEQVEQTRTVVLNASETALLQSTKEAVMETVGKLQKTALKESKPRGLSAQSAQSAQSNMVSSSGEFVSVANAANTTNAGITNSSIDNTVHSSTAAVTSEVTSVTSVTSVTNGAVGASHSAATKEVVSETNTAAQVGVTNEVGSEEIDNPDDKNRLQATLDKLGFSGNEKGDFAAIAGAKQTVTLTDLRQASQTYDAAGNAAGNTARMTTTPDAIAANLDRAILNGNNKIILELHPAELGTLHVELIVKGHDVIVKMVTQSHLSTAQLEAQAAQLSRSLEEQGLSLKQFNLSTDLSGGGGQSSRHDGKTEDGSTDGGSMRADDNNDSTERHTHKSKPLGIHRGSNHVNVIA